MSILILLVPLALLLAAVALCGFFYAVKDNQYDDLDTPSYKALIDNNTKINPRKENTND